MITAFGEDVQKLDDKLEIILFWQKVICIISPSLPLPFPSHSAVTSR